MKTLRTKYNQKAVFTPIAIILTGVIVAGAFFLSTLPEQKDELTSSAFNCGTDNTLSEECLRKYAFEIDLNMRKFDECYAEKKYDGLVAADIEASNAYEAMGAPALYIGKSDKNKFSGFFAGTVIAYEDLAKLVDFVAANSIEDSLAYWKDRQNEVLADFEVQVREYYRSPQGGNLRGEELKVETEKIVQQRRDTIDTLYVMRELDVAEGEDMGRGDVTIMVFSDYECPYCKQLYQTSLKQLKTDYVDKNKVRFVFRDKPLEQSHPNARNAANAARCAGEQKRYFEYHDKLFSL